MNLPPSGVDRDLALNAGVRRRRRACGRPNPARAITRQAATNDSSRNARNSATMPTKESTTTSTTNGDDRTSNTSSSVESSASRPRTGIVWTPGPTCSPKGAPAVVGVFRPHAAARCVAGPPRSSRSCESTLHNNSYRTLNRGVTPAARALAAGRPAPRGTEGSAPWLAGWRARFLDPSALAGSIRRHRDAARADRAGSAGGPTELPYRSVGTSDSPWLRLAGWPITGPWLALVSRTGVRLADRSRSRDRTILADRSSSVRRKASRRG